MRERERKGEREGERGRERGRERKAYVSSQFVGLAVVYVVSTWSDILYLWCVCVCVCTKLVTTATKTSNKHTDYHRNDIR